MPDTMDLLAISTTAGTGFDASIMKISEHDNSSFIQELRIVLNDIQHGISKKEAYKALVDRCETSEITSFASAVIQADELGIPISEVLKEQADTLRENRRIRAEEKANKAPVKMVLPLVLCIFPSIFIILLGPALMSIYDVLG